MAWAGVGAAAVAVAGLAALAVFGANGSVHAQSLPSYAARSGLPSFHLVQPQSTVTPTDAISFYGSPGIPSHAPASPRLYALARALENNPDRIYQFVRNSIEFEPQFGLHKGADGVLLDGSGGAFDQAQLVVQLARAAGYGARYGYGQVTLGAEAASILKVSDARQACLLLAAAGTPALVNNSTSCTSLSGAVSSVQMLHVWPEINIGGTWYAFDPALKTHTRVTGIDVWAAAGTNAGSAWSNLMSGVSVNQTNVTGVNAGSVATKMANYTTALQTTLAAGHSNKSMAELTGGWTINPDYSGPRNTALSGATVISHWDGDVPTPFRATIRFNTSGFTQTFDLANMYAYRIQAIIDGRIFKLAVRRCDSTDASPFAYFGGQADGTGTTTCEGQNTYVGGYDNTYFDAWDRQLGILIDHPYAANGGTWADEEVVKSLQIGKRADIIVRTAGGTGTRRAAYAAAIDPLLDLKVVAEGSPYECKAYGAPGPNQQLQVDDDCATNGGAEDWNYWVQNNDRFIKGEVIAAEMKSKKDNVVNLWTELFDTMTGATEGLSGARIFHQHSIGIAINPSYGQTVLDVDTAVGIAPVGGDQPHYIVSALASLASAAEAAAVAQVTSDESGTSGGATNAGRVLATGAALTRLNPGQSSASLSSAVGGAVKTRVNQYLGAGYSVIVPEQAGGGFFARRTEGSEYAWIIGDGNRGTPSANDVDPRNDFRKGATDAPRPLDFLGTAEKSNIAANVAGTQIGAVDLRTGSLSLSEGDEVTIGQGDFPYSLSFNRRYASSGAASSFGELGAGWTHNWESSAYRRSDVTAMLSSADVVSAAPTLIGVLVALQAGRNDGIEHSLISGIALNWWQDEALNNIIQLNGGGRSARFVRLANGGWRNASSPTEELVLGGASLYYPQTFDWKLADKSVIHFERFATTPGKPYYNDITAESHGRVGMTSWTFPTGVVISLNYNSATPTNGPYLQSVTNNVGAQLTFSYTTNPTQEATTSCMTMAGANSDPLGARKECRMAAQRGGRLQGISNGVNTVNFGYLEDCHMNTSYCAYYLTTTTGSLRRNRYYGYGQPSGAATTHIFGYQRLLETITDDGIATPRARFVWSAVAGEYAPEVRESRDVYDRVTTYYSTKGIFSAAQDALANRSHQAYDPDGRLIDVSDPMGRNSHQDWYGSGRSRRAQSPWGDRKAFEYDAKGNLTKVTRSPKDGCGTDGWWCQTIVVTAEYDSFWNKPTKITLPATIEGQAASDWLMTYNAQGLPATQTGPAVYDGKNGGTANPVWRTWYDGYGRVNRTQDPTGVETSMVYGGNGLPAFCLRQSTVSSQGSSQWGGGLNLTTNTTCNSVGDVTTVTNPRGNTTTSVYDALRRKTNEWIDGTGIQSFWGYDIDGDLVSEAKYDNTANVWRNVSTQYSLTHKPLTVNDPSGDVSRTCYDALDRPFAVIDPTGRAKKTLYNAAGQTTEIHRYLTGNTADTACNLSVSFPSGVTNTLERRLEYNSGGLLGAEVDANGNYTTMNYDGLGRLITTNYSDGTGTWHLTNQRDQLVHYRERDNRRREPIYDALGRVAHTWEHEGGAAWANGRSARTNYDLAGRPMYKDVSVQANGVWDDGLNRDQRWYGYDAAGRMVAECNRPRNGSMGENFFCTNYGYDAASNRTSLTWTDGFTAVYGFDAANRVSSVSFGGHSATYAYDTLGHRTALNRSNGANTTYAYEPDGDLASISHAFAPGSGQAAATFSYGHDAAGRIIQIDYSRGDMEWKPQEAYARSFGAANVMNQVASMGGASISYNANGNITAHNGWTYDWTFGNRLIQSSTPGRTVTYAYDSEDRRTVVIDNGVMTRTIWSGADEIAEYDTSGNLIRRFIPDGTGAPDARLATYEAGGAVYWYHTDHQGSVFGTSNGLGNPVWIANYSPQGEIGTAGDGTQLQQTPLGSPFGYTGRQYDQSAGLYYYRARYYMPGLGQFMSTDPIGSKDDPNLYMYVGGDGVNKTDPTGMFTDVYIGGAGDQSFGHMVQSYVSANPGTEGRTVAYFNWRQGGEALAFIRANAGNGEPINIIGHSYGADTAIAVARSYEGTIDNLVGVDPVSQPGLNLYGNGRPDNVENLVNIDAQGAGGGNERIERLGKMIGGGTPRAYSHADVNISTMQDHANFEEIYKAQGEDGLSGKDYVDQSYRTKEKE